MDRLHLLSVFVAVGEEESFAAGARRLGMSPPAVTRAIATLEAKLGVKLLSRTTRFVRVTEAGQRYLDDARRIMAEIDEADEAARGVNAVPRGQLTVTAPVLFGKMFVMPVVVDFLKRYPEMEVSALFLDRLVNMLEEGVDVGVRIGELPDSSMKAIRVGQVRRVLAASPEYLAKHGVPQVPSDLNQHTIVAANTVAPVVEWKFAHSGETATVRLKPRLQTASNDAAIQAVRLHFGITRLLSYQIAPYIENGELQTVLADYAPPLPIHVIHREGRYASAKVRNFVDAAVANLREHKFLN